MEGGLEILEGGTGPRVTAEMKGVLVALGFVFVFETVIAVLTCVLLFHLVGSEVVWIVELLGFLRTTIADVEAADLWRGLGDAQDRCHGHFAG
jgi:hypothetical protein